MSRAEKASGPSAAGQRKGRRDAEAGALGSRDLLVPYVLLAISAQKAHGYLIEQYLKGLGLAQVEMSTLYRTLRQLEGQGLVTSSWEPGPDGPARRVYSLTDAGSVWLRAGAAALAAYRASIDAFFSTYRGDPYATRSRTSGREGGLSSTERRRRRGASK